MGRSFLTNKSNLKSIHESLVSAELRAEMAAIFLMGIRGSVPRYALFSELQQFKSQGKECAPFPTTDSSLLAADLTL
jgi:hypothetical protein